MLVDAALVLVHLVVICDDGVGEFGVPLHEGADGTLEIQTGACGHCQNLALECGDGVVKVLENVW